MYTYKYFLIAAFIYLIRTNLWIINIAKIQIHTEMERIFQEKTYAPILNLSV